MTESDNTNKVFQAWLESPIGWLRISGTDAGIQEIIFEEKEGEESAALPLPILEGKSQLNDYFEGQRRDFDLHLKPVGTVFQTRVWQSLLDVPYGHTTSYRYIADVIGNPKAVRAVGAANGANPISIVVPCHRIVGSNGQLTGYGGGLPRKKWLLEHEQKIAGGYQNRLF